MIFGTTFGLPQNAYATCINTIQSQTIAAAYEGDAEPTVHHMDTCSGDDVSYQIPIATTVTFDGVEYSNIYATTNSIITFGQPSYVYWDYPPVPSISLYSMDWYPGVSGTSGLDIYYSEGGFQLNLNMVPFGNYGAQPSTVNILVAITNTGGLAVSYSYQGPEYQNLRTGVRLHDGSIVSLEAWGATQVSASEPLPTLQAEPIPEPTSTPTEEPMTPEEVQAEVIEAQQLATEIADLNYLIASINNEESEEIAPEPEVTVEPEPEITPDPEPTEETLPDPDVEVEPEIITPEDPRFPDDTEEQNPEDPATRPEDSETVEEPSENEEPSPEPESPEEDTDESPVVEPETPLPTEDPVENPDNNPSTNNNMGPTIDDEELKKLNKLIAQNDAKLLAQLTDSQKKQVADSLGIKADEIVLIAKMAQSNPIVAEALQSFSEKAAENADAPMPYTLADAIVEEKVEALLSDPAGVIGDMLSVDLGEVFGNLSSLGSDMTDDQREKAQEVIIPVILVSNIVSSVMSLRRL